MRVRRRSVVVAALVLVFTVLPLAPLLLFPTEFLKAFSVMGGIDIMPLLYQVALIGVATAVLVLLKGAFEEASPIGLALSIISGVFWFIIILFALSLGKIENPGLVVLGGSGGPMNVVILDLRLFVFFAAVNMVLKVAYSVLRFHESKLSAE